MNAREEEFLKSLRATFKIEAGEHLQTIAAGLLELEKTPPTDRQREIIETIFRAAHSLKGASRSVNFTDIEIICQSVEDTFATWKRSEQYPTPQTLDAMHRALDQITHLVTGATSHTSVPEATLPPPLVPPPLTLPTMPPPPVPERALTERPGSSGETVRIGVAKLDAQLLKAEEMLGAKLAANQLATDLRDLTGRFDVWAKEWASLQPDLRALQQDLEPAGHSHSSVQNTTRLVEFFEWNHDFFRSLESRTSTLCQTAEQDRLAVGKLVDDLLEDSKKLLMLPLATQGGLFPKVVRDLSRDQGKEAELIIHGEDVELDKRILEEMKDPIIHLLRNCVDHGIESPERRRQLGKPPRATITLSVTPVNGNKVELKLTDDGAGIEVEKVKAAALKHGFLSAEEAQRLTEAEALALVFRPEVSTSPMITQLSGRGLGLAIVREKTEKLGGHVSIESQPNIGTTIRIVLPIALATFRGILVETTGRLFVVPTAQVQRVTRFKPEEVRTVEGRETLSLNGRVTALVWLRDVLELPREDHAEPSDYIPVVILGTGEDLIAFAVDAIQDEREVLVKQLGKPLSRVRNIAGATVLGSGKVAPILHIADLLRSARRHGGATRTPPPAKRPEAKAKSILIVEDSITSRMLLKGILESAGYQVKTAVDGIEGFTTLRAERFDLVVSDVEMPRLDGFALTARIRADKKLAELPIILVTALETREDRERGIDVGANAYLVKSDFDQSNLLEAVKRLA